MSTTNIFVGLACSTQEVKKILKRWDKKLLKLKEDEAWTTLLAHKRESAALPLPSQQRKPNRKRTMPTAIAEGGPIIKALDSIKAMDIIDKSSATTTKNNTSKELPQDYVSSPFSPADDANHRDGINNNNAQGSPEVAGNVHAWVSPNKSDEVASSKESSPDVFNQTSSPDSFNLNTTASSDDNKENENNVSFKSNVVNYGAPPIAVVGKRLHKPQKPEVPPLEAVFVVGGREGRRLRLTLTTRIKHDSL